MSAMGEYGRIGLIGPDDAEEEWDDDSAAGDASAAGISDADLYADEINFHHFKQFRINAIVHEKRGVVGFSKTRRHDTTKATAQWIREIAGERRGPALSKKTLPLSPPPPLPHRDESLHQPLQKESPSLSRQLLSGVGRDLERELTIRTRGTERREALASTDHPICHVSHKRENADTSPR